MLELIGVDGLTQWDVGRQIKVDKDVDMVHFSNRPYGYSKNVKVTNGVADVPDMFLTSCAPLRVWAYVGNFENGYTKIEKIYEIKPKNRPEDYIYTPEEIKTWEKLQSEIGDLSGLATEAKENIVASINETVAKIQSGNVTLDTTLTQSGKAADAKAVGDALDELKKKIPESGSGGGLSADEKTLLLTLLKNAKYAENIQPAYEQLEALFNGGAIVTYTVTNNLTDLTTDNEAATITAGFPYKATLADADGNKPTSVEVVMGGVDVSGEYYADGVIDIPSVSGELVITAFAKNTYPVIYNLANTPVTCNADLYEDTGLAFGSESADGYTKSWTMVVKVKNVSAGYLWCVNGQKALSSYYENRWNNDAGDKVMTINTYICNTRVSSGITQANPDEVRIVITKEALSQKTATVHYLSWAGEYVADTVTGTYAQFFSSAYAANMMIGGQTGADFVGTIEEFVIYEGIMQENEIKVVLGV